MPGPNELDATLSALAEGQRVFGRYTLGRVLGRGTLGVVWLARDEEKRRNVELKFLPEVLARDMVAVSDLRTEVERVRGLQHDAFQAIHDFHEGEGRAAVSSEFVPGNTLGGLCEVRLNGCFDAAELLPWIEPLADAFAQVHEQLRLVHRALHPGHFVLTPAGRVKVLDFGVAHTLLEAAARHASGAGTSAALTFSSPQLSSGALPVPSDDIYALGATLYDLLAGAPPIFDESAARLPMAERRAALNRWGAPIPPAWETAIASCLARDPAQRPASVAALVKTLREGFVAGRAAESTMLKLEPAQVKPNEPASTSTVVATPPPAPVTESPATKSADPSPAPSPKSKPRTTVPPPAVIVAPIATTLPEVEAAQAITVQRAHHRGALVALVCIGLAVWIARLVADRTLPPVLPDTPTAPGMRKAIAATGSPIVPAAIPEPPTPLIAAAEVPPEPVMPDEPSPATPDSAAPETPRPIPEIPAPAPSTPIPVTPAPAIPAPSPPAATPEPKPATPAPATPMPAVPVPAIPEPAAPPSAPPMPATPAPPPPATPAPKPATPAPATPIPVVPVPAPTATVPPSDTPATPPPPPGPRRAEPVPSHEPPKPGEPWTNSLGMPFVPVPRLPVLVAIWETRSRDFQAFAKSIALHWKPAKGGPDYPATDVSFLDAMLFCEWLTTNEESAGRLKPGQHYRLPTDAEWSAAAGLPPEHGEGLRERDDASDKSFPWGNAWPPPPTAGNFRGVNATGTDAANGTSGDVFEQTSPVGSFAPNRQGLFDMAGNVAEMVSDFIAPELGLHATRGGSYLDGDRRALRTRARGVGEDDHGHTPRIGFRVVFDPRKAE